MEHTIAYLEDDVEREARLVNFLKIAVETYAPHVINDINKEIAINYPRARIRIKANG